MLAHIGAMQAHSAAVAWGVHPGDTLYPWIFILEQGVSSGLGSLTSSLDLHLGHVQYVWSPTLKLCDFILGLGVHFKVA
jgi:hypothetical protein